MFTSDRTSLHLVTTPQEMPVLEAVEIEREVTRSVGVPIGTTIINRLNDTIPPEGIKALQGFDDVHRALTHREEKRQEGKEALSLLTASLAENVTALPNLADVPFGRASLDKLVQLLASHEGF